MGLKAKSRKYKILDNGMHEFSWILDTNVASVTENATVKEILIMIMKDMEPTSYT